MIAEFAGLWLRLVQGVAFGAPTLLVGVVIAGILRHLVGAENTRKLFGNGSWRGLLQSWALGMLLPVCSLGVIPVAQELRRSGVSAGAIIAFSLTAPLFNPVSLLYGLTLADPLTILIFTGCSLVLVTVLGSLWERSAPARPVQADTALPVAPGIRRMAAIGSVAATYLSGSTLVYCLIALAGNLLLTLIFPAGSLQNQFAHDDFWAPPIMMVLSVPLYATPMTVMSQIGSMFVHGNSIGAAYTLLAVGTGLNLGLLAWVGRTYSWRATGKLTFLFCAAVLGLAYAMEKPLYHAGKVDHPHTHAFDIYSAPFPADVQDPWRLVHDQVNDAMQIPETASLLALAGLALLGGLLRWPVVGARVDGWIRRGLPMDERNSIWNRALPASALGLLAGAGLIALSILGCYVYYPAPAETLEEMRFVRAEALSAAASRQTDVAVRMIQRYDDLTRRLQVGHYLRTGQLDEFQRVKCQLLRGRLEALKDALEAGEFEGVRDLSHKIFRAHTGCRQAFLELASN